MYRADGKVILDRGRERKVHFAETDKCVMDTNEVDSDKDDEVET